MTEPLTVCRGVEVTYGTGGEPLRALAGVDLTVERHDSLALLGRSGSGKTTLLHVLGGLVEPTAGQVERPEHGMSPRVRSTHRSLWTSCSSSSASPTRRTACRPSCPAARRSVWQSHVRSR